MRVGFAKNDITPRVGVELYGFGPFLCRHSIGVRDRLWARAMALEHEDARAVLVTCDLVGVTLETTHHVRRLVADHAGLAENAVMIACSHTHSGPNTGRSSIGWGQPDPVYIETLPSRIAKACIEALDTMEEAVFAHAEVPCEGIGLNREYDKDAPPLEEVLRDDWRPARPELTDTTCHVITVSSAQRLLGFVSYFGCHPVVCCAASRYIHGDYCGVATNMLEREHPGSVGLFLQGAQGDVNTCVVHKPEQESLLALDIIAGRYANAVRSGIAQADALTVDGIAYHRQEVTFSRRTVPIEELRKMLAERESRIHALDVRDQEGQDGRELRMDVVWAVSLRQTIARLEAGQVIAQPTEVCGLRIGPIAVLGSGFEVFQAIKNDVVERASGPVTLVTGLVNDCMGYAADKEITARGGYAPDLVPILLGSLPYENVQDELVEALLALDRALR